MKYIIIFAVLFALVTPAFAAEADVNAKAYVLIEAETAEILLAHNENEQFAISSLAKIMTLLIVAEELAAGNITLADSVPAPAGVMGLKAPVIWLNPGEVMPLGELVKAVVISSANDAALALAEYIAGSAEDFTVYMNERAGCETLGMTNTFFADPGGFDENTVSTARDVAVMTAALFNDNTHSAFGNYFGIRLSEVRGGTERETQLVNTNRMAQWYGGILGGKAGQSRLAGFCIANCAERDSMRLVAVVLGSDNEDERDALCEQLLDSGFDDFKYYEPAVAMPPVSITRGVEKIMATEAAIPVRFISDRNEVGEAVFEAALPESVQAPVEAGQVVGTFTVRLGGRIVFECDIIAADSVEELTFKKSLEFMTKGFFGC
jgi:D-alanyl-D-alanine carboxypeptidase (penicillin-binding protein 5/6)